MSQREMGSHTPPESVRLWKEVFLAVLEGAANRPTSETLAARVGVSRALVEKWRAVNGQVPRGKKLYTLIEALEEFGVFKVRKAAPLDKAPAQSRMLLQTLLGHVPRDDPKVALSNAAQSFLFQADDEFSIIVRAACDLLELAIRRGDRASIQSVLHVLTSSTKNSNPQAEEDFASRSP